MKIAQNILMEIILVFILWYVNCPSEIIKNATFSNVDSLSLSFF